MLDRVAHESTLIQILNEIYRHKTLRHTLGFKGGTACYLFYDLPRFSVDLDFNITGDLTEEEIGGMQTTIAGILAKYGSVEQALQKHYTLFLLLTFKKGFQKIKVEISRRVFTGDTYSLKDYLGAPMLLLDQPYITAHKLAAILDRPRMVNRDLFDAHFFLKNNWPINQATIEARTQKTLPEYFTAVIKDLEINPPQSILEGLGELLTAKQKAWVKEHLLSDLIFQLRLRSKVEQA